MTEDRTCATCAHAHIVDNDWFTGPLSRHNVDHFCSLIYSDDRHVGSYMQAHSTCKQWIQCAFPRRIWPRPSDKDRHDGIWPTDTIRSGDVPATAKHQGTLEAFE